MIQLYEQAYMVQYRYVQLLEEVQVRTGKGMSSTKLSMNTGIILVRVYVAAQVQVWMTDRYEWYEYKNE